MLAVKNIAAALNGFTVERHGRLTTTLIGQLWAYRRIMDWIVHDRHTHVSVWLRSSDYVGLYRATDCETDNLRKSAGESVDSVKRRTKYLFN